MRELTSHKVNGLNEVLRIEVLDERGAGGACHLYQIVIAEPRTEVTTIKFQNGPIEETGVNGISNEALLAIVQDRLEGFQSGKFACDDNAKALDALRTAINWMKKRTIERTNRGVEGTMEK